MTRYTYQLYWLKDCGDKLLSEMVLRKKNLGTAENHYNSFLWYTPYFTATSESRTKPNSTDTFP